MPAHEARGTIHRTGEFSVNHQAVELDASLRAKRKADAGSSGSTAKMHSLEALA